MTMVWVRASDAALVQDFRDLPTPADWASPLPSTTLLHGVPRDAALALCPLAVGMFDALAFLQPLAFRGRAPGADIGSRWLWRAIRIRALPRQIGELVANGQCYRVQRGHVRHLAHFFGTPLVESQLGELL